MADGSPVKEDESGNYIKNYRIADGKMEIDLNWSTYVESGKRLSEDDAEDKKIKVVMHNFGNIKGEWTLEWDLKKTEKGKTFMLNTELENTGIKVNEVTLYSASAVIKYDFPKSETETDAYDEKGNTDEFVSRTNFSKIIETEEFDSLLFIKNYPENGKIKLTENDCYSVKIK